MVHVRKINLTPEEVAYWLNYDPLTGIIRWRNASSRAYQPGAIAGHADRAGYVGITLKGKRYLAHRVAWACVHGAWPTGEVDHRNLNRSDNRIANLRDSTVSMNKANMPPKKPGARLKGVHRSRHRWRAKIAGKHIGMYETEEAAHAAYCTAATEKFGEFARFD